MNTPTTPISQSDSETLPVPATTGVGLSSLPHSISVLHINDLLYPSYLKCVPGTDAPGDAPSVLKNPSSLPFEPGLRHSGDMPPPFWGRQIQPTDADNPRKQATPGIFSPAPPRSGEPFHSPKRPQSSFSPVRRYFRRSAEKHSFFGPPPPDTSPPNRPFEQPRIHPASSLFPPNQRSGSRAA